MEKITESEEEELRTLIIAVGEPGFNEDRFNQLQDKYASSRAEEFKELFLKPIIPNVSIASSIRFGRYAYNHRGVRWELSPRNEIFRESNYYHQPTANQKLVHFTKSSNLDSIIDSQCLWLKPLDSMEDPNEMFSLARTIGFDKKEISTYQKELYTASFNLFENNNNEEWVFWKIYGDEGKGVGLEFSLEEQDVSKWRSFHCSPVHYSLQTQLDFLQNLKEKSLSWMGNRGFTIKNLAEVYLKLMCFHKHEMWRFEKEIRLLFYNGTGAHKNYLHNIINDDKGRRIELEVFIL